MGQGVAVSQHACGGQMKVLWNLLSPPFTRVLGLKSGHQADSASRALIYQIISLAPSFPFLYKMSK